MSEINNIFTRQMLWFAREDAKKHGVNIPKLSSYVSKFGCNKWIEIYDESGNIVWKGSAYNVWEARAQAIYKIMEEAGINETRCFAEMDLEI